MSDSPLFRRVVLLAIAVTFFSLYYDIFLCRKTFVHDTIIWFGSFHYFIENIVRGEFPLWDPFMISGTPYYPYVSLYGNLDPILLPGILLVKLFDISTLTVYNYFRLLRLFIFVAGEYYLFWHITRNRLAALISASILLFVFPLTYFRQFGALDAIYLTPFAVFFILRLLEDPAGPRRYLNLACIALIGGVSMNIYIPVFFVFNVVFVVLFAFIFKVADIRAFLRALREKRFAAAVAGCILAVSVMAAPPLVVTFSDASGDGELFPMQRIIQRNNGLFKKIMASDIETGNLSNRFTNRRALYNTWGEIVNFIFPDFVTFKYWQQHDLQSEIDHYVGIIPLVFAVLGFMYFKSRYRWLMLAMLAVNFVNGFSLEGFGNKPYNAVQEFFNTIFPPLEMYQGRENLGYFVLLYLCSFVSMGMALFFRDEGLVRQRLRTLVGVSAFLIASKLVISWRFAGSFPATSPYDLFVLLQLAFFVVWVVLRAQGRIPARVFYFVVIAVLMADFYWYNENAKEYSMRESAPLYQMLENDRLMKANNRGFQFFREPALSDSLAFRETLAGTKGAISLGLNHSLFTTKRYYDLLTHLPLEDQFVINGIVYPVLRFFPAGSVIMASDRHDVLNSYLSEGPQSQRLLIEDPAGVRRVSGELKEFEKYEDVPGLRPEAVYAAFMRFLDVNGRVMSDIRTGLGRLLHTPEATLDVAAFSINEVVVRATVATEGYLLYNDGWSKYWRAFDNGREVPVLIANYNSKAVFLSKGDHSVRFVFDPIPYKIGLAAYYLGLLVSIATTVFFWIGSVRARHAATDNSISQA